MTEFHLPHLANLSYFNIAYAFVAICVTYKLAFIARQVSMIRGSQYLIMRASCLVVGSIIIFKAYSRIDNGDEAELIDIIRELSWCLFLASSITILKEKLGHW